MGAQPEVLDFPSSKPPPDRTERFRRLTCADLAGGDYRVEFLIDGVMVARQPLLIFGPPKALKTSLVVDAAISLATASPFLGRQRVERAARVAVMSGESGLSTLQETARRVAASKGVALETVANLIWSPDLPRLASIEDRDKLAEFLIGDEIEVLFVDPVYLAMPSADAGNLIAQGELLREVATLCDSAGVTLALVHHARKNGDTKPGEPLLLHDVAWSGFAEFARQWWTLARREDYRHGSGQHRLWLTVGGSAGHSACWGVDVAEGVTTAHSGREWRLTVRDEEAARRADKMARVECKPSRKQPGRRAAVQDQRRQLALELIGDSRAPMTARALRESAGWNNQVASGVLESLVAEGAVVIKQVKPEGSTRVRDGYALAQPENS